MLPKNTHFLNLLFLTAVLFVHSFVYAQSGDERSNDLHVENYKKTGIVFTECSWSDAVTKVQAAHKYIFVDAYASWCGPCKLLKATTFKNKEVADFFNQNFINLSIDMEKGEGQELAVKWGIQAYPTLMVFDAAGKPVLETIGFFKPKDLIKFGKQALSKKPE